MALRHDSQGFLVGDPVDLSEAIARWQEIRDSVRTIQKAVLKIAGMQLKQAAKMGAAAQTKGAVNQQTQQTRTPQARDARGRFVALPKRTGAADRMIRIVPDRQTTGRMIRIVADRKSAAGQQSGTAAAVERMIRIVADRVERKAASPQVKPSAESQTPRSQMIRIVADKAEETQTTRKPRSRMIRIVPDEVQASTPTRRSRTRRAATAQTATETTTATPAPTVNNARAQRKQSEERNEARAESQRDSKGRFVSQGGANAGEDQSGVGLAKSIGAAAGSKAAEAVREVSDGMSEVDPAVKAMQEVAEPLKKGYDLIFGGSGEEKWLKRIFRRLAGWMKLDTLFKRSEKKQLEELTDEAKKARGVERGGILSKVGGMLGMRGGMLGGLAGLIPKLLKGGAKKIPVLGGVIAGIGALFGLSDAEKETDKTERSRKRGGALGSFGGTVAGGFAGLKAGALIGSIFGPLGTAIGGALGGIAGSVLGEVSGEYLGRLAGETWTKLSDWFTSLDIGGKISSAWTETTTAFSNAWNSTTEAFSSAWSTTTEKVSAAWESVCATATGLWEGVTSKFDELTQTAGKVWDSLKDKTEKAFSSVFEWIKEKTGVDVKGAVDAAKEKLSAGYEKAKGWVSDIFGGNKEQPPAAAPTTDAKAAMPEAKTADSAKKPVAATVSKAVEPQKPEPKEEEHKPNGILSRLGNWLQSRAPRSTEALAKTKLAATQAVKDASGWMLGKTSERFESGGRGAGTVSTGRGDFGGASYGTYQLASRTGTLQKFLKESPYGKEFEGLTPGTAEFNAKWKQIAKTDAGFGAAQHDFIKRTHFDPAMQRMKDAGIDLTGRGKAVQDAVWSTSVQFGAGNGKSGASGMFAKALKGRDLSQMSDADIVSAIQDYKIENNNRLFRSSSASVRAGTMNRAHQEKAHLLQLAGLESAAKPVESVAKAPAVKSPSFTETAAAAKIPSAPKVSEPMNKPAERQIAVKVQPGEVGQDVKDRRIAHVATGGIAC